METRIRLYNWNGKIKYKNFIKYLVVFPTPIPTSNHELCLLYCLKLKGKDKIKLSKLYYYNFSKFLKNPFKAYSKMQQILEQTTNKCTSQLYKV